MKNKKILVFGSSGFLGNHLVESLVENNEVIGFDIIHPKNKHKNVNYESILDKALVSCNERS